MGGVALLARELGYRVSGSDANVYPPMSTQLQAAGITLLEGYSAEHLKPAPDLVVVGNALSRGNEAVEYLLNSGIPYQSGPQWLGETLLAGRWVLAVSGTHGKTTTSSILAWLLEDAGMNPGFLIGGVPQNFGVSARIGSDFFVVEADEYDTAFFDKRSKFVHYRPRTLVINNIEFDHADIFSDIGAIETQFHHLLRCVPSEGLVIAGQGEAIERTLGRGLWTPLARLAQADGWMYREIANDADRFELRAPTGEKFAVHWSLPGEHNRANAVAAVAAAHHVGVPVSVAIDALHKFQGVKRRLELRGAPNNVAIYDDFAHHPTAIQLTLEGMRRRINNGRLIAVIEPRSNTMRLGEHAALLAPATASADFAFWYQPKGLDWRLQDALSTPPIPTEIVSDIDVLVRAVAEAVQPGDHVVVMSNGGFGGIHEKLISAIEETSA